jgi:hypothetical protein
MRSRSGNTVAPFFHAVFLGPLVFTGTLATEWSGDPLRVVYAFDARNPAPLIASRVELCDGPILAVWLPDMVSEAAPRRSKSSKRSACGSHRPRSRPSANKHRNSKASDGYASATKERSGHC